MHPDSLLPPHLCAGLPGSDVRLLELGQAIQGLYTHGGLAPPKLSAATFK